MPATRLFDVMTGIEDRFRILVTVGAGCGLRQGELLGLSVDDVDHASETLAEGCTPATCSPRRCGFERARAAIDGLFDDLQQWIVTRRLIGRDITG